MLCIFLFVIPKGPKATYSMNTTFLIENKNGAMTSLYNKVSDLFNNDRCVFFPVKIQNQNNRDVCYSVTMLVNDKQILTTVGQDTALHHDYKINANDFLNINIEVGKECFVEHTINEILIIFRQDIDCFSIDNPLLEKSNTIYIKYVFSDSGEAEKEQRDFSSTEKPILEVTPLDQKENGMIRKNKRNTLGLKASLSSGHGSDYKLFCLIGSDITKIDDNDFLYLHASIQEPIIADIDISSFSGQKEVELFAIPVNQYYWDEVLKGNRFTLSD